MLDIKVIRENPEKVKKALATTKVNVDIEGLLQLDEKRRSLIYETEQLKNRQNAASKEIPGLKAQGKDVSSLMAEMKELSEKIKNMDSQVRGIDEGIENILLNIRNIPNESVPIGDSDADNIEIRKWGEPRKFDFEPKAHWDIGEALDIMDFERAAKISGSRFTILKGLGARLERAVFNFMLDLHIEKHGYTEILPPYLVHRRSMIGTGQLPKFEEDMFKVQDTEYYLIPTAEVPVTNIYREEILDGNKLPIKHVGFSACFRAEAGSAGRDTRGYIRQHQFNKVELVKFVEPEKSYQELELLTNDAEEVLKLLGIPYRVIVLCTGDMGFCSAKTYDIEAWLPSYNRYVEISSCSNFESYQARRANIKYKKNVGDKAQYVHTLNGSGLAVGRTVTVILENYQQADGSVVVPEVLRPYMGGIEVIK